MERSTGTGETDQGVTTAILSDKERKSVCHALTLESLLCLYLVWSGCDLGGHSMFCFLCFCISMCWPGLVLNQGQLSIVVSDWESYLGSLFPFCHCGKLSLLGVL